MRYSEGSLGRVFVLRLEQGDILPGVIENFALEKDIRAAVVMFLGGAEGNSKVVVGPRDGTDPKPVPVVALLAGVSEAAGVGTIFLNQEGLPRLHLHAAFGRGRETVTGCTREGVTVWHIGEAVILELVNTTARREINPRSGFELLEV